MVSAKSLVKRVGADDVTYVFIHCLKDELIRIMTVKCTAPKADEGSSDRDQFSKAEVNLFSLFLNTNIRTGSEQFRISMH